MITYVCTHVSHIFPKRDQKCVLYVLHGIMMFKKLIDIRSENCGMTKQPVYCSTLATICDKKDILFIPRYNYTHLNLIMVKQINITVKDHLYETPTCI